MSITATIRNLLGLDGRTPAQALEAIDAQLATLRARHAEESLILEVARTEKRARNRDAKLTGAKLKPSRDVADAEEELQATADAITDLERERVDIVAALDAEHRRELVGRIVAHHRETSRALSLGWALVAIGGALVKRSGSIGVPQVHAGPAEVQAMVADGVHYPVAQTLLLAELERLGGSSADLPADVRGTWPFALGQLPIAECRKALAKLLPDLDSIGGEVREAKVRAQEAEAKAKADQEVLSREFRQAILAGAKEMAKSKDTDFISNDERWLDLMATSAALADLSEDLPIIRSLVSRVTAARHQHGAQSTRWSPDRDRAARACGWTGPLP